MAILSIITLKHIREMSSTKFTPHPASPMATNPMSSLVIFFFSNYNILIILNHHPLVNAGTNDAGQNIDIANAGARMLSLINALWAADDMSGTLIILSSILPNTNQATEQNRILINTQYQALAESLLGQGHPILRLNHDVLITTVDLSDDGPTLQMEVISKWPM